MKSDIQIMHRFAYDYDYDLTITELQPTQFRISSHDQKVCDIYPVNQRFHMISCNARGGYTDLFKFLSFIFP